jgi:hypothetical protein
VIKLQTAIEHKCDFMALVEKSISALDANYIVVKLRHCCGKKLHGCRSGKMGDYTAPWPFLNPFGL